jgi:hypothetical protein
VFHDPRGVKVLDSQLGVLADRARALVGAEPGVVVGRVVGEVRRDLLGIASIQRLVVAADVLQVAQSP